MQNLSGLKAQYQLNRDTHLKAQRFTPKELPTKLKDHLYAQGTSKAIFDHIIGTAKHRPLDTSESPDLERSLIEAVIRPETLSALPQTASTLASIAGTLTGGGDIIWSAHDT